LTFSSYVKTQFLAVLSLVNKNLLVFQSKDIGRKAMRTKALMSERLVIVKQTAAEVKE
jgi:hypothetical protein